MIEAVALKIAHRIKSVVPEHPVSINVLNYSISVMINGLLIFSISLLISLFTGRTPEMIGILIFFPLLRQLSGGYHLKSGIKCTVISISLFTLISFITLDDPYVTVLNCISLVLVLLYAPSRIERQSRIPKKYYPLLKIISSLLVASNFLIGSTIIAMSFFLQSLSLIHKRG